MMCTGRPEIARLPDHASRINSSGHGNSIFAGESSIASTSHIPIYIRRTHSQSKKGKRTTNQGQYIGSRKRKARSADPGYVEDEHKLRMPWQNEIGNRLRLLIGTFDQTGNNACLNEVKTLIEDRLRKGDDAHFYIHIVKLFNLNVAVDDFTHEDADDAHREMRGRMVVRARTHRSGCLYGRSSRVCTV